MATYLIYSDDKDGYVSNNTGATWSDIRNATTGNGVSSTAAFDGTIGLSAYYYGYIVRRAFFYFDTSFIQGTVSAASLFIKKYSTAGDSTVCAMKGTQAASLTTADFDSFTGSEYGHTAGWTTGYNEIVFNSTGISDIDTSGITKVCAREYTHDYLDSDPGTTNVRNGLYYSYYGTASDPYLEVVDDSTVDTGLLTGLVSYYSLDNDGYASDLVGVNQGTVNGATYTASGLIEGAYSFDGANDYVEIPTIDFRSHTTGTISCWVKPDNSGNEDMIWDYGDANANNYLFLVYLQNSGDLIRIQSNAFSPALSTATSILTEGSWNHVLVTQDGTGLKIYVNNSLAASNSSTVWFANVTTPDIFSIGRYRHNNGSGWYFDGVIDEFGIWDRALTESERTALYNSGAGFAYPFLSAGGSAAIAKINGVSWASISKFNGITIASVSNIIGVSTS